MWMWRWIRDPVLINIDDRCRTARWIPVPLELTIGTIGIPRSFPSADVIKDVAALFQFIIHVQADHDTDVHVDQLCGEVQIPFEIGSIHDVHDNIRDSVKMWFRTNNSSGE